MRYVVPILGLLVLATLVGCRQSEKPPEPVPVQGKVVTDDGQPVAGMLIRFHPHNPRAAIADQVTAKNGSFELKCPPGKYDICLMVIPTQMGSPTDPGATEKSLDKRNANPFPDRYFGPKTSPWQSTEVPADGVSGMKLTVTP